jgi:hypothetical protein
LETDRTVYLALAELTRRYGQKRSRRSDPLTAYELRCFSQHGEDGVIAELLSRVGSVKRFFVEFGIESGREGNCVFLADVLDWDGLFIEPDESAYGRLARKYAASPRIRTLRSEVTPTNVETLFAQHSVPAEPDVMSIDVDGSDYWIWDAIAAYRARLLVIEYNAALSTEERLVQPPDRVGGWDGTDYFGASLRALVELGERKGYQLVHTDLAAANAFFVRSDLVAGRFPPASAIPRRGEPNYFMTGYQHPSDPENRGYVDPLAG